MSQGNQRPFSEQDKRAQEILEKAQAKDAATKQKKAQKSNKGVGGYFKGVATELKATTWPKPMELLRWCLIVIATVLVLSVGAMVIDSFVATPFMYWISTLDFGKDHFGFLDIILVVGLFVSGIGSVIGVYMHQGGDTEGLSDTMVTRLTGGSGQVQKNLDRITLACIILFVICLIVMMVALPHGTIAAR